MKKSKMIIRKTFLFIVFNILVFNLLGQGSNSTKDWQSLFDGKTLNGWKASEKTKAFVVSNGIIIASGGRSHLYYIGSVANAKFENFELKVDVLTEPGTNSGIFIHTDFQEEGWPKTGYEVQINNSHEDSQKTGGLFNISAIDFPLVNDLEWFNLHIIVKNKNVIVKINDLIVTNYTETEPEMPISIFSNGTIALQAHSEGSVCYFKNIRIKLLE